MKIRQATSQDLEAIVGMLADDMLGAKREHYDLPLPEAYTKAFEAIDADANQELLVAEDDSHQIIGTMQLTFIQYLNYQGGMRAQIESVQVHGTHRGRGIGNQMIRWAIDRAKSKGAFMVQLTSDKQRPAAIRFYQSLGFVASHEGMKLHFK